MYVKDIRLIELTQLTDSFQHGRPCAPLLPLPPPPLFFLVVACLYIYVLMVGKMEPIFLFVKGHIDQPSNLLYPSEYQA